MDLVGNTKFHFQNWSKTYGCRPLSYFEPKTVDDLQKILSQAKRYNYCVKVVGSGCSPSQLACTHGYMISMKNFSEVLHIDKESQTVEVQAGIPLYKLNTILQQNGLALPVLPTISDVTLVGAISTGTHGSGINYQCLSSYVLQIKMMLADGSIKMITKDDGDDVFGACCLSLGSLGVILSITYQCQNAFNLHQSSYPLHYKDLVECLDVHISSSDHFRFHWFPHTDMCQLQHISRSNKAITSNSWFAKLEYILGFTLHQGLMWLSYYFPRLTSWTNKSWFRLFKSHRTTMVDVSHKIFNFNCLYMQYVMEWAIPIEETGKFLTKLVEWTKVSGYPAHSPVEFRFSKEDDVLLSPSFGRNSCYINIISWRPFGKEIPHEEYWNAVEKMALDCGGRPHWAKDHRLSSEDLRKLYPKWDAFLKIRESFDPDGLFLNTHLKGIFNM